MIRYQKKISQWYRVSHELKLELSQACCYRDLFNWNYCTLSLLNLMFVCSCRWCVDRACFSCIYIPASSFIFDHCCLHYMFISCKRFFSANYFCWANGLTNLLSSCGSSYKFTCCQNSTTSSHVMTLNKAKLAKKKWVNLNMAVYYREKAAISITLEAGKYVVFWKCGAAETFKYECPTALFGADKSSDLISKGSWQ